MLARLYGVCADTAADVVAFGGGTRVVAVRHDGPHVASGYGKVEAMKVLIDNGADVNFANKVSAALAASIARTAVWCACGYGG